MDGPRDVWATALALALLDQAQREQRTFALLGSDARVKFEAVVKPGGPTFRAPWEAQAFAMAVVLHERGHFTSRKWAARLAK